MRFKILQLVFGLMLSGLIRAEAMGPVRDLDSNKTVELTANSLVLFDQEDERYKLVLDVSNPYTNYRGPLDSDHLLR